MEEAARRVLADASEVAITALPDGSVDHRHRILGSDGTALGQSEFAAALEAGAKTVLLDPVGTEPGGMAVNAARQVHALGPTTRLLGHLDHDVFDDLPFESASMGAPADVKIYDFEESAVMLTDESTDLDTWTARDARAALGDRFDEWLGVDAVICSNWASVPNLTTFLEDLAASNVEGGWIVVDPGDVTVRAESEIANLVNALDALSRSFDVVLNPNDDELAAIADARRLTGSTLPELLTRIRADAGIAAVVMHAAPEAAVATRGRTLRVPNYDTRGPVRFTGGGDRFTGGLATALAAGADWEVALRIANACATFYIASGETATADDLWSFPEIAPAQRSRRG